VVMGRVATHGPHVAHAERPAASPVTASTAAAVSASGTEG